MQVRVGVIGVAVARNDRIAACELVDVAQPNRLHLLPRVGLGEAHVALLVQAARLGVGAAPGRLGQQVEMAFGRVPVWRLVEQMLVQVTAEIFAVAAAARQDEEVLELLAAQAALVDAEQRLAHRLVRLDVRVPLLHVGHLLGRGLAPRLLARHEQVVVLVGHEPALVAPLPREVVGAVGECEDVRLVVKGVVVARIGAQAVLDQVEHVLVPGVAVLVGRAGDGLDLIPQLLGSLAVPFAVIDELGQLLLVAAEVALEELLRQVHELVRHDGAVVLEPPPLVPHTERRALVEAEHVVAHCLHEVVAQLRLLEAGAPEQSERPLADLAVLALVGLARVVAQRAAVVVVGRLLGLGPRLLEAVLPQAGARPQLARRALPRDRQVVGRALAVAGGQEARAVRRVVEVLILDVEEDSGAPGRATLGVALVPLVTEHDRLVKVRRHVVQHRRLVLLVVKVHLDATCLSLSSVCSSSSRGALS